MAHYMIVMLLKILSSHKESIHIDKSEIQAPTWWEGKQTFLWTWPTLISSSRCKCGRWTVRDTLAIDMGLKYLVLISVRLQFPIAYSLRTSTTTIFRALMITIIRSSTLYSQVSVPAIRWLRQTRCVITQIQNQLPCSMSRTTTVWLRYKKWCRTPIITLVWGIASSSKERLTTLSRLEGATKIVSLVVEDRHSTTRLPFQMIWV